MQELIALSARRFELGCKLLMNNNISFEIEVRKTDKPKLYYVFKVSLSDSEFEALEEQFKLQIS